MHSARTWWMWGSSPALAVAVVCWVALHAHSSLSVSAQLSSEPSTSMELYRIDRIGMQPSFPFPCEECVQPTRTYYYYTCICMPLPRPLHQQQLLASCHLYKRDGRRTCMCYHAYLLRSLQAYDMISILHDMMYTRTSRMLWSQCMCMRMCTHVLLYVCMYK
jgi:hypothetical protein